MHAFILTSLLAATAFAAPAPQFDLGSLLGGVGGSSATDVEDGVCKPVTLIFARGTSETGNMGNSVGPALATKLKAAVGGGKVAVQGVNYPADVAGAVTGSLDPASAEGSQNMAKLAKQAVSQCPDTKIALSGYSQGAQQVHGALMDLDDTSNIAAVVTFGDPLSSSKFQNVDASITKVYCEQGDAVCQNSFIITAAHLSYASKDTGPAAEFIAGLV